MNSVIKRSDDPSKGKCLVWTTCCLFGLLLLLRDSFSVAIPKEIFILFTAICIVYCSTENVIKLLFFVMPLYVGLPGNFMTVLFLGRFVLDNKKMKFKAGSSIFALLIAFFVIIQNIQMSYMATSHMLVIVSPIFIWLLFSYDNNMNYRDMSVFYMAGTAAVGLIMLISTLQVYEFSDLLSTSFRLGSAAVDYTEIVAMNVSMDPNVYGMFTMIAVMLGVPMFGCKMPILKKILMIVSIAASCVVGLIGLSRTFIIMMTVWILLYCISRNRLKTYIISMVLLAIALFLVDHFMPDVLGALIDRFNDDDMATGSGRTKLITKFFNEWQETGFTLMFGVGLQSCNVHSMPLQILFGGGVVLALLVIGFVISLMDINTHVVKLNVYKWVPMIVAVIMISTVPAVGLLNFMFPLILVALIIKSDSKKEK